MQQDSEWFNTIKDLQKTVQQQSAKLEQQSVKQLKASNYSIREELAREGAKCVDDIEALREVTVSLIPHYLRVLLDLGCKKVLEILEVDHWEDLCKGWNMHALTEFVVQGLANTQPHPSREALQFLCSYNNIRRDGNITAHMAREDDLRRAITSNPIESPDQLFLEQIFGFIFLHPV
ncbi:hypothetical protein AcW1_006359 [Taiwanofungus camphoratus]|nr:hypothetical protein AcW2_005123 [Antrodia cinnamomea]KAI0954479.1 hypothetical protein AcW1_006359 [Antrodia cinnamomea]